MEDFISELGIWLWWIVAIVLATLELMIPGVFLIWFAGAAALVGVIDFVFDLTLMWELAIFAVLSVLCAYLANRMVSKDTSETDHPLLNERGASLVGRILVLEEAIKQGRGKVNVDDSIWVAEGPDADVGQQVRVVSVTGTLVHVELIAQS
ncbi:MAG: NfeD family protein [Parvibaculaceae bacterium]|nr:NfeD family protein [Parvibaculaceae bacterium]